MDSKLSRIVLKAKIRGLSQAAAKSRELIKKTTGPTKDGHWHTKRAIGVETRLHILASAYLRGIPYREVERNTDDMQNPVDPSKIAKIVTEHGYVFSPVTTEKVRAWLQKPATEKTPEKSEAQPSRSIPSQGTLEARPSLLVKVANWAARLEGKLS